ncbi:MAG: hypothetical protein F4X64_07170 [Chloroflexi bacterium]|nr:hypothetical protein [Chloroflexota bacterium]
MRTMIGKRIGPVPIALVAVLALAAFISAGLWLTPTNGAHADEHDLADVTLDVGEALAITEEDVQAALETTDETGVAYAITSDQDGTAQPGGSGLITAGNVVTIDTTTGAITVAAAAATQAMAIQADNTATITVTATRAASVGPPIVTAINAEASFDLTIIQNPIEVSGADLENPNADTGGTAATWPSAGDCVVAWDGTNITSRMSDAGTPVALHLTGSNNKVSGGDCTTDGDSVDVEFTNSDTDDGGVNYLLYVTGGGDFDDVMPQLGKGGLTERAPLNVGVQTEFAGDAKPGKEVIKVSRDMAGPKGFVYVIGYAGSTGNVETNNLDDDSTTFGADATFVVEVLFVNAPDKAKSTAEVTAGLVGDTEVLDNSGKATVTATVNDKNGNPVKGVLIDFILPDGTPDGVKFANRRDRTFATADPKGMAMAEVMGLSKSGPVRVGVEVSIGDDFTKMVYLVRKGPPASADISAYADDITVATGEDFFVRAVAYDSAMNDVSHDDDTNLMVKGSNDDSAAAITVSDVNADGDADTNADAIEEWWESLNCEQMNDAVMPMDDEPAVGADDATSPYCKHYPGTNYPPSSILSDEALAVVQRAAMDRYKVMINDDADAGEYSIETTAGTGSDAVMSEALEFTVLGGIDALEVTGPPSIGGNQVLGGFMVEATSDDGKVPGNVKGEMVSITFSPVGAASVIGSSANNMVTLDAKGMAAFSILITARNLAGDNLVVIASHGTGSGQTTSEALVVRGRAVGDDNRAPMAVGSVSDFSMTLGDAPMTVTAGFADADGDTLGYSVSSSDTAVATAASNGGGSVTVTAVGAGSATITVTASDGTATATQTFMVTVMAPVDTSLGMPSGLSAMGGDMQVTLSWMGGANATRHWVAGVARNSDGTYDYSKNVWTSADDATTGDDGMMTLTVMGLENGTTYVFTVASYNAAEGWGSWLTPFATATPAGSDPASPFPTPGG